MTADLQKNEEGKILFKNTWLSEGRYLFNICLPSDYPVIDDFIDKKKLKAILNHIALNYPKTIVMDVLDKIKEIGFYLSTKEGYTLSIDDVYMEELEHIQEKLTGNMEEDLALINKNQEVNDLLKQCKFSTYIESGARGSWQQAKQLVLSRGYVADATNKIRPNLIRSSLSTGLNRQECFDSCWGSRKGLLDTAISTGDSGYLTRQLVYATCSTELGEHDDCNTKDGLELTIKDNSMAKAILWRYYYDENGIEKFVSTENYGDLVGKTIKLRSPIYCTTPKICKKCYGKLYTILHSPQIGIIAASAIGERTTQLVLRTFHISGVAQGSGSDGDNDDIISGMSVAKKIFHNPMSIDYINNCSDLIFTLHDLFSEYGNILLVHYEVIIQSMMWNEDKKWRLEENRDKIKPEFVSVLQVPSRSSWLLACAFSNLRQKLMSGLVNDSYDEASSITQLFRF